MTSHELRQVVYTIKDNDKIYDVLFYVDEEGRRYSSRQEAFAGKLFTDNLKKQETEEEKLIRKYQEKGNRFENNQDFITYLIKQLANNEITKKDLSNQIINLKDKNESIENEIATLKNRLEELGIQSTTDLTTSNRKVRIINS